MPAFYLSPVVPFEIVLICRFKATGRFPGGVLLDHHELERFSKGEQVLFRKRFAMRLINQTADWA